MIYEGLRIITNTTCNRRCSFCYQKDFASVLDIDHFEYIIKCLNFVPKYITIMGGEFFYLDNYKKYLKIVRKKFRKIPISITTNGDYFFKMLWARINGFNITTSNRDSVLASRINYFFNGIDTPSLKTKKPVTLCMDMRNKKKLIPMINNLNPVKVSEGHYKYTDKIHIFNGEKDYGKNEMIVLPNGRITNTFKDVINYGFC